jgi:hypothetical protein
MIVISVIVGSTREGRFSEKRARGHFRWLFGAFNNNNNLLEYVLAGLPN